MKVKRKLTPKQTVQAAHPSARYCRCGCGGIFATLKGSWERIGGFSGHGFSRAAWDNTARNLKRSQIATTNQQEERDDRITVA